MKKFLNILKRIVVSGGITALIITQVVLIDAAIKLKKQNDTIQHELHDMHNAYSALMTDTYAHIEDQEHVLTHVGEHTHDVEILYRKALKDIKELIKIVRDNGEYCIRKGDVGCGH